MGNITIKTPKVALQADLWYNKALKTFATAMLETSRGWMHLDWRYIVDTLPPLGQNGNSSYVMIPLGRSDYALADLVDLDLADRTWYKASGEYAVCSINHKGVFMHRIVMERILGRPIKRGYWVDHINGVRHDNRRANLREVTPRQNSVNKRKPSHALGSSYKGVTPKGSKWIAAISYQRKNIHIGIYENEEEAAKAYDLAAISLYGEYARTNGLVKNVPSGFVLRSANSPIITTNTTGYRGVFKMGKRWRAQITVNKKAISLGGFANPEEAARAYDKAAITRDGIKAITNFPLSDYDVEVIA